MSDGTRNNLTNMIRFGEPTYLYLLFFIPVLALFLIWAWKLKQRSIEKFAETDLGYKLSESVSKRRQKIKNILLLIIMTLIIFALARPQYGYNWKEVKRRGVDIMIAVDLSRSMLAGDVSPNRIERARRKIIDLLNIAEGDRIGLIGFAGRAFVLTPLTLDYGAIRLFADQLSPDLVPVPGTAVAEAIELANRALKKGNPESKGLIIMSDGEDMAGEVVETAKKAAEESVKIYTLGIGSTEGAPIPLPMGGFQKDGNEVALTKLDEKTLIEVAEVTNGKYVRSVTGDRDLEEIYKDIQGELEEQELKESKRKIYIDRFQWFLVLAILLLLVEMFMRETKRPKKERFWKKWFKTTLFFFIFIFLSSNAFAFGVTGTIKEGERLYNEEKYEEALEKFLEAQVETPNNMRLKYNIANTYYRLGKFDEAKRLFNSIPKEQMNKELKEHSIYNRGNSEYRKGELEKAVKSYEEALMIDPDDEDAKYNLEFVKKMLEQQKKQQEQKKDKEQKQNQEHEQKRDQEQEQEQEQERDQEQEQKRDQEQEQKQNQESRGKDRELRPEEMNREQAERWLETVKEGKRKNFPAGMKSGGKHRSIKNW